MARFRLDPLLAAALAVAGLFHGGLLASGSFRRTYDAYVHIFFADHYARGWFQTWEPRWYTGFTVTSYPPGTHQLVALLSRPIGLEAAYVAVQLAGVLIVVIGIYRLTRLIASPRAAGIAALLAAVATGIGEAVHVFGQLPTVCSLGLLLNSLPSVRRWVVDGDRVQLTAAVALLAGTTALHHVTTLFGAVFFIGPVVVHGLIERFRTPLPGENPARSPRITWATLGPLAARRLRRVVRPLARTAVLGMLAAGVLVVVVFPYWVWTSRDPIVQIPIPHASRDSFLANPNAGLVFWLIPWGPMLLALPYAIGRGLRSAAWPVVASIGLLALLGTGGTTPIPRMLLGGAFEILTLDRFTFWATVLTLPFAGMMGEELIDGRLAARIGDALGKAAMPLTRALAVLVVLVSAVFTVNLTHLRPMQPAAIDPGPIVDFLERDQHSQWRYLTLGFGDQMAWLAAQTTAHTVDGNYHSARRLPELISYPVERVEGAKFRGIPGLGSLQQFLAVPERYHLKFIFSNDQFYDPLLYFSGWRTLGRLDNGIVVWEREDVAPMPAVVDSPEPGPLYRAMWGSFPPLALVGAGVGGYLASRPSRRAPRRRPAGTWIEQRLAAAAARVGAEHAEGASWKQPIRDWLAGLRPSDRMIRVTVAATLAGLMAVGITAVVHRSEPEPEDVVVGFYDDLDFRRYEEAWERLNPHTRPSLADYLLNMSVGDGLLASYASLDAAAVLGVESDADRATVSVQLSYVTPLAAYDSVEEITLARIGGRWFLDPEPPDTSEPAERLVRRTQVDFETMGRLAVTSETTEYDDILDRPDLTVDSTRVVRIDGRPVSIGRVTNVDADPAAVTVTSQLFDAAGGVVAQYNSAAVIQHSLLPGESTPFRVDFEGIAGVADVGTFRPDDFVPIGPIDSLTRSATYAKAVVTARGLDRPTVLRDIVVSTTGSGVPQIRGSVLNLGTSDATVVAALVALYDLAGELIWIDQIVLPEAVRPGLEKPFVADLTARSRLEPAGVSTTTHVNGLWSSTTSEVPAGFIALPAATGYSGLTIQAVTYARSSK